MTAEEKRTARGMVAVKFYAKKSQEHQVDLSIGDDFAR